MRTFESWMVKGATVSLTSGKGTLTSINTAIVEDKKVVLSVQVKREGVQHSFPFSPWDISEYMGCSSMAPRYPEQMGTL